MSQSNFVDFRAVKREINIVQVLEHYGLMSQMHRNGDTITGSCPIHDGTNKTAFRVSVSKNCWNCFSRCHCGGNVLDFVAKKENISLLKAAKLLVEWFGLKIESPNDDGGESAQIKTGPRSNGATEEKKASQRHAGSPRESENIAGENKPLEFVLKNLQSEHPYLTERGLSVETVATFGLGFCSKGLQKDRIAIPIHNAGGQLVAYCGRWPGLTDNEKYQLPKGFLKSLELFNLHRALTAPANQPLVIVEGFFDCMKLWQHGVKRVVALMGSSLSPAQEQLVCKHTDANSRVILMLDEDDAGREAREDIAARLSKFRFVRTLTFEKPGTQPEHLSAHEVNRILAGVS